MHHHRKYYRELGKPKQSPACPDCAEETMCDDCQQRLAESLAEEAAAERYYEQMMADHDRFPPTPSGDEFPW